MDWEAAPEIGSAVTLDESRKLAELAQGRAVLEVGTWMGRSTVNLASTARLVHSIDWHRGEALSEKDKNYGRPELDSLCGWRDNMVRYQLLDKVVLHVGTTAQVCPFMRGSIFDLAFIDAGHERDEVTADLHHTSPLLRADAVICMHDYTCDGLGVRSAADQWFGRGPDEIIDTLAIYRPLR